MGNTLLRSRAWWSFVLLFMAVSSVALAATKKPAVRPISDAERAAVEIVADFLARGPEAFWDKLATNSPLRQFGREKALEEIEVRTGPHHGAVWELQTVVPSLKDRIAVFTIGFPSGLDDTLVLDMVSEGGTYKVANLRILAEPTPATRPDAETAGGRDSETRPLALSLSRPPGVGAGGGGDSQVLLLGILGAAAAIASAFVRRPPAQAKVFVSGRGAAPSEIQRHVHRYLPHVLGSIALVFVGIGVALAFARDPRFKLSFSKANVAATKVETGQSRLSDALALRRILASGTEEATQHFQSLPAAGLARDATLLWKAQVDLQHMRVEEVEKALSHFESPSNIPLAEVLRGRLGFFRSREVDAVLGYERAINLGPGRDALWLEAGQVLSILGFEEYSKTYLNRLERMGSRHHDVYYTLAMLAAEDDKVQRAEDLVRRAWKMRPIERSELISAAILWEVIRRPAVAAQIKLNAAEEAMFAAPDKGARPVQLPLMAVSQVSGDFLHIDIGEQELLVPGGASLAPPTAAEVDAAAWSRSEEQKSFQQLPHLLRSAQSAGVFTQPVMRRKIERAASALADHNRWIELLQLTDSLSPRAENVPTELFFLRGKALTRSQRLPDAKRLYVELAASRSLQRRSDARTMLELGEMLESVELYDAAIKMMERAARIREIPYLDERIRQISMDRRLATAYSVHRTANFDVHYPKGMPTMGADAIGDLLEKEFARLKQSIPITSFQRVTVNIVEWAEFRSTYTGSDHILGFYNGKITLPFAGVPVYIPQIVAILTHELTHAVVAQATNDQAPRWFQEGIAQRMEMHRYAPNAFNMYEDDKLFSLAVLDAVIGRSPDPEMMKEAYIESQTVIRYIEAKYGWKGVTTMIAAFREGLTAEEAVARLGNQSLAAFDTQLRAWGRSEARVFENPEPIRYDENPDKGIRFSKPKGLN